MAKKSINGWNVKISRTLIDSENCTDKTIRFFAPSIDNKNQTSFNILKSMVTDNDKTKPYVWVWVPKKTTNGENFLTWCYFFSKENGEWEFKNNVLIGFNKIVALLDQCFKFTRQLLKSIQNGLIKISEKAKKQINKIFTLKQSFEENEKLVKIHKSKLDEIIYANVKKTDVTNNKDPIPDNVTLVDNVDIKW